MKLKKSLYLKVNDERYEHFFGGEAALGEGEIVLEDEDKPPESV